MLAKGFGYHADFVALHPVLVATHRIDLAIVRDHTERLSQRPLRERVGRIPLVIYCECRDETLVLQVQIEIVDVLRQEHALVDQG